MYCVKCGVELDDAEERCPLCGTRVYHPDIERGEGEPLSRAPLRARCRRSAAAARFL